MYTHLFLLLLLAPLVIPQAPGDEDASCARESVDDITRVLLDTYNYNSLLPTPWIANGSWSNSSDGTCRPVIEICNGIDPSLLFTQLINTSSIESFEVSVFVEFTDGDSTSEIPTTTSFSLGAFSTSAPSNNLMSESFIPSQDPVMNNTRIAITSTEIGLYLRFGVMPSTCVAITRVRVLYTICPARSSNLTMYMESRSGQTATGQCVDNSRGSPTAECQYNNDFQVSGSCMCNAGFEPDDLETRCNECQPGHFKSLSDNSKCLPCPMNSNNAGMGNVGCMCEPEYMRTSSDNTTACTECAMNHYMSGGGVCMTCPMGSNSIGGQLPTCDCRSEVATNNGNTTTSSSPCDSCRSDYYRNGGNCMQCPSGSNRAFEQVEDHCFCMGDSSTSENAPITTGLSCDGCINGYFLGGRSCTQCPTNSNSTNSADARCRCNPGSQLENGVMFTNASACSSCSPGFFSVNRVCTECPSNSVRMAADDDEDFCTCSDDYRRSEPVQFEEDCLVIVGFKQDRVSVLEGLTVQSIPLCASGTSHEDLSIPISVMPFTREVDIITTPIDFLMNSVEQMVELSFMDNAVALEESTILNINIPLMSTPNFVVGGPTSQGAFYSTVQVTIQDDDNVYVGFSLSSVSFNESSTSSSITITRTNPIGSDLTLTITGGDSPGDNLIEIEEERRSLTFSASNIDTETKTIPFRIIDDTRSQPADRTVILGLKYMGRFNNSVIIGGGSIGGGSHFASISIVIVDNDRIITEPFSVTAIIGVSAAGAGMAILLLLIVILCLCICRLRVNRQGFYPTYEDKTSEPPTMLRYSASLRSISSQTVVPVAEGRSIQKENEFYV